MQYTFGNSSFLDKPFDSDDSADPMSSLANLADVMLVFACGLMMALVVFWNLDLPNITEFDQADMQQVDDVEEIVGEITSTTNPYMELGKVYQDPSSGKLYMLTETDESAEEPSGETGGTEAASSDETRGGNDGESSGAGESPLR